MKPPDHQQLAAQQHFADQQQLTDQQHLRLLSIFHYVYAGFVFLGLLFIVGHFFIMRFVMTNVASAEMSSAEAAQFDQIFPLLIIFYVVAGCFCLALGIGNILCGGFLRNRRHKVFIVIISALNCLNMPLGTVLGIFTLIVLFRPSVSAEFERAAGIDGR